MLMLALVFTAQPLASRIGPRLRWRSLRKAISMDGPEMANMMPTMASGISHTGRDRNPPRMEAMAVPMAPMARPMAAKIPANLPTSNGAGGAASALAAAATPSPALASTALSLATANFSICSPTMRAIRL